MVTDKTGHSITLWTAGGWLSKEPASVSADVPQLTFSFQAQSQEKGSSATSTWHIPASAQHVADEASLLRQALAGFEGHAGLYLAPVLYRPTIQVCSHAESQVRLE